MRIIVTGDIRSNPILLDTDKATSLVITDPDNSPAVIYLFKAGGYIRYTKGEDTEFDDIKNSLGL